MTTAYDVPASNIITMVADNLKENENIQPPEWAGYVKTGVHKELPPIESDWWYTRCAAVLRKIYMGGPIGVERLCSVYGGKKNRGSAPSKKAKGSGAVAREVSKQLEAAGLVRKMNDGRVISPAGRKLMDNTAHAVKGELISTIPELAKY